MKIKSVYTSKDGRQRAYYTDDNGKHHVVSYPRLLVEQSLGIELNDDEDIHHIDEDVTNNSLDNLQIIKHGDHQKMHSQKYFDKEMICDVCGKPFIWTAKRQSFYYIDLKRGRKRIISCSNKCSSKYARLVQLGTIK